MHSRYIGLPRFLEIIFVTPQYHLIHHSQNIKNHNSNFGVLFSIWDRMFGTYTKNMSGNLFGVKDYYQSNFIKVHTDPMVDYYRKYIKPLIS